MNPESRVRQILDAFAERTGLTSAAPPRRYLWTDAFAVCAYLSLHRAEPGGPFLDAARRLVDQVHHVLGRFRDDDARRGWISGLDDEAGERHPTAGGLRIGKPLPERAAEEPFSSALEWERDGQYFHYLTKWALALHRLGEEAGDETYSRWARELMKATIGRFTFALGPGQTRMVWKMSTDLSRPLVSSMGQHDPLDGLVVAATLQAGDDEGSLAGEMEELFAMCRGQRFATPDALGIGGLLTDGYRLLHLSGQGFAPLASLAAQVLDDAVVSLAAYLGERPLALPAAHRLAFRELGLSLGLAAAERVVEAGDERFRRFLPVRDQIERFWLEPEHQAVQTWREHLDINEVMLAASLAPVGVLGP